MKIDLAGPKKRGLAMGLNEFAGYFAVAGSALATGFIAARYGLRPEPFYLGVGFVAVGLLLSALARARDASTTSRPSRSCTASCRREAMPTPARGLLAHDAPRPQPLERQPGRPRQQPERRHGVGPVPALLRRRADEPRADRHARRDLPGDLGHRAALHRRAVRPRRTQVAHRLRACGSRRSASASWSLSDGFAGFAAGAALLGVGTAMVYPTLLAAIGDVAHPSWRASSVGVYRLWRDLGYAIGALLAGVTADALGLAGRDVDRRGAHVRLRPRRRAAHDRDACSTRDRCRSLIHDEDTVHPERPAVRHRTQLQRAAARRRRSRVGPARK